MAGITKRSAWHDVWALPHTALQNFGNWLDEKITKVSQIARQFFLSAARSTRRCLAQPLIYLAHFERKLIERTQSLFKKPDPPPPRQKPTFIPVVRNLSGGYRQVKPRMTESERIRDYIILRSQQEAEANAETTRQDPSSRLVAYGTDRRSGLGPNVNGALDEATVAAALAALASNSSGGESGERLTLDPEAALVLSQLSGAMDAQGDGPREGGAPLPPLRRGGSSPPRAIRRVHSTSGRAAPPLRGTRASQMSSVSALLKNLYVFVSERHFQWFQSEKLPPNVLRIISQLKELSSVHSRGSLQRSMGYAAMVETTRKVCDFFKLGYLVTLVPAPIEEDFELSDEINSLFYSLSIPTKSFILSDFLNEMVSWQGTLPLEIWIDKRIPTIIRAAIENLKLEG